MKRDAEAISTVDPWFIERDLGTVPAGMDLQTKTLLQLYWKVWTLGVAAASGPGANSGRLKLETALMPFEGQEASDLCSSHRWK